MGRLRTCLLLLVGCGISSVMLACVPARDLLTVRNALNVAGAASRDEMPKAMAAAVNAYCVRCNGTELPLDPIICGAQR